MVEEAEAVFTPSVVLAELARKYLGEGDDSEIVKGWLQGISEATEVYPIDIQLAIKSAESSVQLLRKAQREKLDNPGLGDALVLATARAADARLLTGDRHFKGLEETIWLGN